jgi:exopolysaccharide production protein ExoQ
MPPQVAAIVYVAGILGLFWLDRDKEKQPSKALWIPVFWLLVNGSRPISSWLQVGPRMAAPNMVMDGSPLDALVYAILLALALPVVFLRLKKVGTLLRANWPIVIFFLYCGLSVIWSEYPFVALKRWTKVVADLIMVMIVLTDSDWKAAFDGLVKRLGFVLIPISILLIKYFPDMGRGYDQWDGTLYNIGVGTNKNLLGMTCLIVGIGVVWRFLLAWRSPNGPARRKRLLAEGILLGMTTYLLWISNSMTSLSCFGLASILLVATTFFASARRPAVINTLVASLIGLVTFALFFSSGGAVLESMGRNATLTGRTEIWHVVLGLVDNPIIGSGFESFWLGENLAKTWNLYWFHLNEAHNGYIELFLNLGWIGILIFATVMATGYRDLIKLFRVDSAWAQIRLAYFVNAAIYSITEVGFRMLSPVWIFFLFSAMAIPEDWYAETSAANGSKADSGTAVPAAGDGQISRPPVPVPVPGTRGRSTAKPLVKVHESRRL